MDEKKKPLTESDVLKALYHMYCAAEYKGSVTMSSETAIGLYNFFNAQKDEINQLNENLSATIAGQETLQKHIAEQEAKIEELVNVSYKLKTEAIKEFAKRLKARIFEVPYYNHLKDGIAFEDFISKHDFDNLVKEMEGDVK